jgi:hypothetical protein
MRIKPMNYDSTGDVRAHQFRVAQLMMKAAANLLARAQEHDASKLEEVEKPIFDAVLPTLKNTVFGTPEYAAEKAKLGVALAHHHANNSHHPEFYDNGVADMTLFDLIEMLCDWKAAGERDKGSGTIERSIAHHLKTGTITEAQAQTLRLTAQELFHDR